VAALIGLGQTLPSRFDEEDLRPHLHLGGLVKRRQPHDAAFPAHNFSQKVRDDVVDQLRSRNLTKSTDRSFS
jgi:hypothetical protein